MIQYDPAGTNNRKTKDKGWVPGRSIKRPTRRSWERPKAVTSGNHATQKQRFALIATMWELVSPAGIAAWAAAIPGYQSFAIPGTQVPASAFTLFMYVNVNLMQMGSPIVLLPPTPTAIPTLLISDVSLPQTNGISYTVDPPSISSEWRYFVRMSRNISPGVSPVKSDLQLLVGNLLIVAGAKLNTWSPVGYFAENSVGLQRNLSFTLYSNVTGQTGAPVLFSAVYPPQ